jgi:hypothetical protein
MRRRPMELWWIAAFCLTTALWVFTLPRAELSGYDRTALALYGGGLLASAALLMLFSPAGRWMAFVFLGVEAAEHTRQASVCATHWALCTPFSVAFVAFSLWMLFYLQRPSTARLFTAKARVPRVRTLLMGFHVIDLLEACLAFGTAWAALLCGAPLWMAGACGIGSYVLYTLFLEEWVRQRWAALFARLEPGFPAADAPHWRAACHALACGDLPAARERLAAATEAGRAHPAGRLLAQMLAWQELVAGPPPDGWTALRRAIYDQDWQPSASERQRLADCVECSTPEMLRALAD